MHNKKIWLAPLFSLLSACGGSGSPAAGSPAVVQPAPQALADTSPALGAGCAWQAASQADLANVAFPDSAARYWVALVPVSPGNRIRINGRFPDARYFSFNSYDAALRPTDAIADVDVLSAAPNPFRQRGIAPGGDYTAFLRFGPVPETRAPATFYAGNVGIGPAAVPNSVLVPIIYRVYVSHTGETMDGGVGLPLLTVEGTDGGSGATLPTCAEPILPSLGGRLPSPGINEALLGVDYPDALALPFPTATYPPRTRVFYGLPDAGLDIATNVAPPLAMLPRDKLPATGGGGFLSNIHNAYTSNGFARRYGNLFLVRAKAPSWRGRRDTAFGAEQLRYWSLCQNEFATQRYTACRIDAETPLDNEGYFTVAISDAAERPVAATDANGITWLAWGPYPDGLLIYRHMLPNPGFREAIQNVPKGSEIASVMHDYTPVATYCRPEVFDQAGLTTPAQRFAACVRDQADNPPAQTPTVPGAP